MSEQRTSVLEDLRQLALPEGRYMVMGSGILDALGIRPAEDVDLVVGDEVYESLAQQGWSQAIASNGSPRLEQGVFQVYDRWLDESEVKKLEQLLPDAQWVDGVAYNSLAKLVFYKQRRGRDKDLQDVELMKPYLDNPTSTRETA